MLCNLCVLCVGIDDHEVGFDAKLGKFVQAHNPIGQPPDGLFDRDFLPP